MNKREAFGGLIALLILSINISAVSAADITINSLNSTGIIFAGSQEEFYANVTINETITNVTYFWQLGNGENITNSERLNYTYAKEGDYTLKINVSNLLNSSASASKTLKIKVYQSKYSINLTIDSKFQDILNVKSEISKFSSFKQESINDAVNFDDLESQLDSARDEYNSAVSDSDYVKVINKINSIKTPTSIFVSESIDYSAFYPSEDAINFDAVTGITGESYDRSAIDRYIGALNAWNMENLDIKIKYERISLRYSDSAEPVVNFFDIAIAEKNPVSYYVIIKNIPDLAFDKDYSEKKIGNYFYTTGNKKISFSTTEEADFTNVPLFISPRIESLDVQGNVAFCNKNNACESERGENWQNCSDCSRAGIILGVIIGLVVLGIIIYFILRWWYNSKYENSLFKNKTDLYNLLTYMNSTIKKGYSDKDVRSRLKKAGWTSEQITYAMRRYAGKRTGLP